jgi:PAS domain S-box-containing protein
MEENGTEDGQDVYEKRYHHLIEHVHDAVVEFELVRGEPIVRDVNDAFVDVFGYEAAELRGESLNDWIVPEWHNVESRHLDERTDSGEVTYRQVERQTTHGLREFLYRGIPYEQPAVGIDGVAIYTDLTDITRQKRQLRVTNRVLRHNLRNTVNVISGAMDHLIAESDDITDDSVELVETVENAIEDLKTLTRDANDINTVINATTDEPVLDCVPLIEDIVSEYSRGSPEASLLTTLPTSTMVHADVRLRFAIESLVDNAIEHNLSDAPTVRIRIEPADSAGWVDIYVDDDAPLIPENERSLITGDTEITALRHGSGLGLWLAKWTTELFGGKLSFTTSEFGGNSVRIRLPQA